MGGNPIVTTGPSLTLCERLIPGIGLNMGMEPGGNRPPPPPVEYAAYSNSYDEGYS